MHQESAMWVRICHLLVEPRRTEVCDNEHVGDAWLSDALVMHRISLSDRGHHSPRLADKRTRPSDSRLLMPETGDTMDGDCV